MSIVASFVSECAGSGRWVRGILALHGCMGSEDEAISRGRIHLASTIVSKQWNIALNLINQKDTRHIDQLGSFLYHCTRSPHVPSDIFRGIAVTFLNQTKQNTEDQNILFQFLTKWSSWWEALYYFRLLNSPDAQSVQSLTAWLNCSKTVGSVTKKLTIDSALSRLDTLGGLVGKCRKKENMETSTRFCSSNSFFEGEHSRIDTLMKLTRAARRGDCVSWKLPLALLGEHRIVEDAKEDFVKMIGMCCPHLWRDAMRRFGAEGSLALWVASRHSWRTALEVSKSLTVSKREMLDIFRQCATPEDVYCKLISIHRATQRLWEPSKKAVAHSLAGGYLLEELQLSPFIKACDRHGDWETSLQLLDRLPTKEFQRRAIHCLLKHRSNTRTTELLGFFHARNPATTHTATILIKHSVHWQEALHTLNYLITRGTSCNPQILSAFMDVEPPIDVTSSLLKRFKQATNNGIRHRFEQLKNRGDPLP